MISLLHRMYAQEESLRIHDTNMAEHILSNKLASKKRKKNKSGRFHVMTTFGTTLEPLYLTVINTLILSQDRSFARYMFVLPHSSSGGGTSGPFGGVKRRGSVKEETWRFFDNASWYKERNLGSDVTLGDIAILCVLRTALLALFRQKDKYLLSNCLAILSNLGPHVANMHAYTAERVVTIIEKLGKRIIDTELKFLKRSKPRSAAEVGSPTANASKKQSKTDPLRNSFDSSAEPLSPAGIASYVEIMQNMQDTLRVVLVLVGRAIRPALQISNVQLIYALIRAGHKICSIVEEPMIMDIAEGTNFDDNGLAHMSPPADAADDKKSANGKGVKKLVNKLGNMLSQVVKTRKRDNNLPPVDMDSSQLPIVYIPLLIKKGIKWMERTSRATVKPDTKTAPQRPVQIKAANVSPVTAPSEPPLSPKATEALANSSDEGSDDTAMHRTAQEVCEYNAGLL